MRAWLLAPFLVPVAIVAQQDPPPTAPAILSRADEVRYATSAAPAGISKSGRFHSPRRPALVYMESSSQVVSDRTGRNRSHFMPHLMIFYPGMKNSSMGITASKSLDVPDVVPEGTPMSALVVVMRDWVRPDRNQ